MKNVINLTSPVEVPFGILIKDTTDTEQANGSEIINLSNADAAHKMLHTTVKGLFSHLTDQPEFQATGTETEQVIFMIGGIAISQASGTETFTIKSLFHLNGEELYGERAGNYSTISLFTSPDKTVCSISLLPSEEYDNEALYRFLADESDTPTDSTMLSELQAGSLALAMHAMIKGCRFITTSE